MEDTNKELKLTQISSSVKEIVANREHPGYIEQYWEELEDLFQTTGQAVAGVGEAVNDALNIKGVKENLISVNELNIAINGLKNDLLGFTDKLVAIHNRHLGRTGKIDLSDFNTATDIFGEYIDFNTVFKSLTLPTFAIIMDHIGTAANIAAAKEQTNKTNEVQ